MDREDGKMRSEKKQKIKKMEKMRRMGIRKNDFVVG
jgi:hypothetical protein